MSSSGQALTLDGVQDLLATGVAVIVATVDSANKPALTRGWGVEFDGAVHRLDLCVTAPVGSATFANLIDGAIVSVTASQPTTYRTAQLKGMIDGVGDPTDQQRERIQDHLGAFAAEVAQLGITEGAERLFVDDLLSIGVVITDVFDQTPRVGAGERLA